MTDTDKLAQVLTEHQYITPESEDEYGAHNYTCQCGEPMHECYEDDAWAKHAAHVAAVVLAHLTAEGWAQGKPEYAVSGAIMHPVLSYDHGAATTLHTKHGMPVVRRYVTDWEPVEGEEANDE